ncbi:MAG: hypothetical protein ACM3L6_06485 [Deltaproteobacteria bacterium]
MINDILSCIISSTRLGLYGRTSDGAALARIILEHLAILDHVVDQNRFEILNEGLRRGFNKVSIDYGKIKFRVDGKIRKLHSVLSDAFYHCTNKRVAFSGFHRLGIDCIGASIDVRKIRIFLGEISRVSLFLTRVMREFNLRKCMDCSSFTEQQDELEREYEALKI